MHNSPARLHAPIVGPAAYSPEWHALRQFQPDRPVPVVIGASEAAAACNQSPYATPLDLYLEKRGQHEREFREESENRMDLGRRLEPIILDVYADQARCLLELEQPVYLHPDAKWMAATPDAIAFEPEPGGAEWCVDAKSTNWRMLDRTGTDTAKFGTAGTDEVPLPYLFQAQQQMAVLGMHRCDFPVLVDARELRIYTVHRSDELIAAIISAERELVERIRDGRPPEPNWSHEGTTKALARLWPEIRHGEIAHLTEAEHDLVVRRGQILDQIKTLETQATEIRNRLLHAIGDAELARFPDADFELRRTKVEATYWGPADLLDVEARLGSVKRGAYVLLTQRKIRAPKEPKAPKPRKGKAQE